ncbi:MAG: tetratricopeptide repeat protein [Ardenticatenaceae bacterium]|nr:tetratricopeptide repeat protein [Ardenticatenaceae bacterium]
MDTAQTITTYLERITDDAHPLMAQALYLTAVPNWYTPALLMALRQQDDLDKNTRLAERMTRYSFITTLDAAAKDGPVYAVRPEERAFLQRRWILKEPQAYRAAHGHALAYWQEHEDANPFAQAQNLFYHRLFVDLAAATDDLLGLFRNYRQERQFAAIERLLETAVSARFYLTTLGDDLTELDDTIAHLQARLAQLRGHWDDSLSRLNTLRQKKALSARLRPLVSRAYGHALAHTGKFVEAIAAYDQALVQFDQTNAPIVSLGSIEAEKAYTLIALGDAHVGLALAARGYEEKTAVPHQWQQKLSALFYFFLSLPLLIYLSFHLGRTVWLPRFWQTLRGLDWMIARLYALGARHYKDADPILEQHGKPAEGVAADERLGNLYLAAGDVTKARQTFEWLLRQTESPLGDYRKAVVQVGLGEALLRLGKPEAAREQLAASAPMLKLFEDLDLLALTQRLLAGTWLRSDPAQAIPHLQQAITLYRQQGRIADATNVSERLRLLLAETELDPTVRETAETTVALPIRQYPARYRHRITVAFQRVTLILLTLAAFIIPISSIRLETGSAVEPVIAYGATPLLQQNNPNFVPDLSQGVSALNLAEPPNPRVLWLLAVGLFLLYLALTTAVGLWNIVRTPLSQVQAAGQAETVRLDDAGVSVGARTIRWEEANGYLQADVAMLRETLVDNSLTAVLAPNQPPLNIHGKVAWYTAVQQHIQSRLQAQETPQQNRSYSLLLGGMGVWYILTVLLLLAISWMGRFTPDSVTRDFLGPYSLADLYPYLYLGLFVPPFWWFVLRPLPTIWHTQPHHRLPLWLGAAGLILAVVRVATLFRPWFTVPDIYPPLAILLLAGGGTAAVWQAKRAEGTAVYPRWAQVGAVILLFITLLIMGDNIWREVGGYHYLVRGNTHRDQVLALPDSPEKDDELQAAVDAYTRAIAFAQSPILGMTAQIALRNPIGLPSPISTTWLAAVNSRAAMSAQLGQYAASVYDYDTVLQYTSDPTVYVNRAIAYLGLGTQPGTEAGTMNVEVQDYGEAVQDFNQAIEQAPGEARYVLWRGVAYHALSGRVPSLLDAAQTDYEDALAMPGAGALDSKGRAQAWTGLGWIAYQRKEYETAVDYFQKAADAAEAIVDPQVRAVENETAVEALLGLGYAYYSLRQYDEALAAWNAAAAYNDAITLPDPVVYISLGTLYWRVGTLGNNYEAFGEDRCQLDSLSDTAKLEDAQSLEDSLSAFNRSVVVPGQTDDERAFTYRTMGQVTYLLRDCPGYDKEQVLKDAYDEYVDAVALAPDNAGYWFRKSRLAYAVWVLPGVPNEWLEMAVTDMGGAIEASPQTAVYWHDRAWMSYLLWQYAPSDAGVSAREWLFAGLADVEQALTLDDADRDNSYRPNYWEGVIYKEAVDGTLKRGDRWFAEGEYATALDYYTLVAENVPEQAVAALKAGLAAAALDDMETAAAWYADALLRAQSSTDTELETLTKELQQLLDEDASLERSLALVTGTAVDPVPPPDAATFFSRALLAVQSGSYTQAAQLYEEGLLLAAADSDRNGALDAAYALRDYLLEHESVGITAVYWPALLDDEVAVETAVADLPSPDLYWRYRAEFGFQLINRPFRQQVGNDADYFPIFDSITADIRRAYALDAEAHQVWYDFFVDANIGWLYLRRADDLVAMEDYEQAVDNYAEAIARIQPNSENARGDLSDAIFGGALTALRLEQVDRAERWYAQGLALVQQYDGLDGKLETAVSTLESLLADNPDLASAGETILQNLEQPR